MWMLVGGLLTSCGTIAPIDQTEAAAAPQEAPLEAIERPAQRLTTASAAPLRGDTPPSDLALRIAYPEQQRPLPKITRTLPTTTAAPAESETPPAKTRRAKRRLKAGRDRKAETSGERLSVRTTAYCSDEADHFSYGSMSAIGKPLRLGAVRSAAADWSRYPAGTRFRIVGDDTAIFEIDDYGSALVGKNTIDLYQPNEFAMDEWGVRHVEIEVLQWGSAKRSLEILRGRAGRAHIDAMIQNLENSEKFGGLDGL